MNAPDRRDIVNAIAAPCLVVKDRAGRALFISDFPKRMEPAQADAAVHRLEMLGFTVQTKGEMALIDLTPLRRAAWFEALPEAEPTPRYSDAWGVWRLLREHPSQAGAQDAQTLGQALRLYALGRTDALLALLQNALAQALREGRPPPYHAAALLGLRTNC